MRGTNLRKSKVQLKLFVSLAILASLFTLTTIQPATAATDLSETLESGSHGFSESAGASVVATGAAYGNYYHLDVNASASTGYVKWTDAQVDNGYDCWSARFWVNPKTATTGQSIDTFSARNTLSTGGTNNFDLFRVADAANWKWDLISSTNDTATGLADLDDWDLVETRGCYGTAADQTVWKAGTRIDGVDQGEITSTGQDNTAEIRDFVFGNQSAKTNRRFYDGLRVVISDSAGALPAWLGPPGGSSGNDNNVGIEGQFEDFESGAYSMDSSGGVTVPLTGAAYGNTYQLDANPSASTGYVKWDEDQVTNGYDCWSSRFYLKLISATTNESIDIHSAKNTNNVNNFDIFRISNAADYKWDILSSNNDTATGLADLNDWDLIETRGCFGTNSDQTVWKAGVKIDGVDQGEITSTGQDSGAEVQDFVFGNQGTKTNRRLYDGIKVVLSDSTDGSLPAWLGAASGSVGTGNVIMDVAGDIACEPGQIPTSNWCVHEATSDLVLADKSAAEATDRPFSVQLLGDNQYVDSELTEINGTDGYDDTWGRFKSSTHPAPGNHEYQDTTNAPDEATGYYTYWGSQASPNDQPCTHDCLGYYAYNVDGTNGVWRVYVLNRALSHGSGSTQYNWLVNELSASTASCEIAVFHEPFYTTSSSSHVQDTSWQDMVTALYDNGADLVLSGHQHWFERFGKQDDLNAADATYGLRAFTVGTGGRSLQGAASGASPAANSEVRAWTGANASPNDTASAGVLQLQLNTDATYSWTFRHKPGHALVETGQDSCHGAP